jgi:hypothetical protein
VSPPSAEAFADAIDRLLADAALRQRLAEGCLAMRDPFRRDYGMEAAGRGVAQGLRRALRPDDGGGGTVAPEGERSSSGPALAADGRHSAVPPSILTSRKWHAAAQETVRAASKSRGGPGRTLPPPPVTK